MRNSIIRSLLAGLFVLGSLSGCSDDSVSPSGGNSNNPPALPELSTMKFSLDFYGVQPPTIDAQSLATGKPSAALLQLQAEDHSNWINAYVRAVFVYLTVYDLLDEPIGAFAAAIHSVPQKQDDGSYLWTYIFVNDGNEYSVFLYGMPTAETVQWRLEVSSNNAAQPLDHFVWFSGESKRDETGGSWQFFQPIDQTSGVETIRIDWAKSDEHEGTLTVTANGSGLENAGDALIFTESKTTSSIEYFDAGTDLLSSIVWHTDGSGSLTVPDYNGGATACWDHRQINVACE